MKNDLIKIDFTEDQENLIRSQIAPKATPDELKLFLYQCKRTGLDPMARQIYAIHRWNGQQKRETMTIQTSIDGFRVIAERSGDYAGQDEPIFNEESGKIINCKISVYRFRGDVRYQAAVGVAYWEEYVQRDKEGKVSGLWLKMPHVMISKVAEALALRKAYPQDLSGLYTSDEMNQADPVKTEDTNYQDIDDVPTEMERKLLMSLVYLSDLDDDEKDKAFEAINTCTNYKQFEKLQHRLEERRMPIDQVVNPSQKDINQHIKKITANGK